MMASVLSCTEEIELDGNKGTDFFPLDIGQTRLYAVDEITITGSVADTSTYFLKEVIEDSVSNGSEATYLIYRYISEDTTAGWSLDSIWTTRKNSYQAIVTENNIPFVKLTFPVKAGVTWDGNALNTLDESEYMYERPEATQVNGRSFNPEELIRVVIADVPANLVEQDQRNELYANGIGLIQKDYISAIFCQPGSGCEEVGTIDEGRILLQSLISYEEE